MTKEEKKLCAIIKKLEGNVLAIGITEGPLLEALEKNEKIKKCNLLNALKKGHGETASKQKNFNIRNLRKKFHKKKIDYIICHIQEIYPYMKTFVKDSVYINRKKLYFYGEKNTYELDKIVKRYQKYHAKIKQEFEGNYYFLIISNEQSKTNKIKDFYFMMKDFFSWFYDFLGDILIN